MSIKKTITIREEDDQYLKDHPELCFSRLVQGAIQQHKKKAEQHDKSVQSV